jgi:cysteine desulfurase
VLLSLGLSHSDPHGTLVQSFDIHNTEADITKFLESLQNVVTTLRNISPLYQKARQGG